MKYTFEIDQHLLASIWGQMEVVEKKLLRSPTDIICVSAQTRESPEFLKFLLSQDCQEMPIFYMAPEVINHYIEAGIDKDIYAFYYQIKSKNLRSGNLSTDRFIRDNHHKVVELIDTLLDKNIQYKYHRCVYVPYGEEISRENYETLIMYDVQNIYTLNKRTNNKYLNKKTVGVIIDNLLKLEDDYKFRELLENAKVRRILQKYSHEEKLGLLAKVGSELDIYIYPILKVDPTLEDAAKNARLFVIDENLRTQLQQSNPKLLKSILLENTGLIKDMDTDFLFEHMKDCASIIKVQPEWLLAPKCPVEWYTEDNLISYMSHRSSIEKLTHKELAGELLNNRDFCAKLLGNASLGTMLVPKHHFEDLDFLAEMIEKCRNVRISNDALSSADKSVFLIGKLGETLAEYLKNMQADVWYDVRVVRAVAAQLDKDQIYAHDLPEKIKNYFHNHRDVITSYEEFVTMQYEKMLLSSLAEAPIRKTHKI